MLYKVIFFLLISLNLFSATLQDLYYVNSNNIKLRDIFPHAKYDVTLYQIDKDRYTKRVKTTKLVKVLEKHGFKDLTVTHRYTKFVKKSPISTAKIEKYIIQSYKQKYPDIKITALRVIPRAYIDSLPQKYETIMPKRFYLTNEGTLSVKTPDKKKIFFDYKIEAKIKVYFSRVDIKKSQKVSTLNTIKKIIKLDKLKALPININHLNTMQSKRNLKKSEIITIRDISKLNLVKKGSMITVVLQNNNINISFLAKALQNGKLRDIITLQKNDKKRIKAIVVGKNRVEMQ